MSSADEIYGSVEGLAKRPSATDIVLNLLRKLIAQGDLQPGQRLPNERELAARLGVSRASLREGMRALAAMNIVTIRHGDGTYVSSLDPELLAQPLQLILSIDTSAIYHLFEVRRITEPAAATLAASRGSEEDFKAIAAEMRTAREGSRTDAELVAHDTRLHRLIHQAAHNPLLLSVSASLAALAHEARKKTVRLPGNADLTLEEHQAVADAILDRDEESAASRMLAHLTRIEDDLRKHAAELNADPGTLP